MGMDWNERERHYRGRSQDDRREGGRGDRRDWPGREEYGVEGERSYAERDLDFGGYDGDEIQRRGGGGQGGRRQVTGRALAVNERTEPYTDYGTYGGTERFRRDADDRRGRSQSQRAPYYGEGGNAYRHDIGAEGYGDRGYGDTGTGWVEWGGWSGDRGRQSNSQQAEGSHRGRGPKNYTRSDERIREDVNDRLSDDDHVDASDIEVSVSNCEVTLDGTVTHRSAKRRAEDVAESVSGVRHVQNNLRVKQDQTGAGTEAAGDQTRRTGEAQRTTPGQH
jgi:Predicted periplasmic or secreted lipoprotein